MVVGINLLATLAQLYVISAHRTFSNEFAVYVPSGPAVADQLAEKHGFHNTGQIGDLQDYYLFEHRRLSKRSANQSAHHNLLLTQEPEVKWFEQQRELRRVKRDFHQSVKKRDFADASNIWDGIFEELSSEEHVNPKRKRQNSFGVQFSDPMFREQWFLNGGGRNGADMNVKPAWRKGYTGKGVVVSILDDGIQHNHPDLAQNYDPFASTDINDSDQDPMPQDNGDNKHGTRCAGEVAAVANNGICGVGIAFNASIGGVRMLDGVVNDAVEARALSLNPNHIDIYSASWGPEDDGRTVDGPGPLAKRAFLNGVTRGRKGKGSIFVWASGNGGRHVDDCNCDGYTNSIFTLSISSASQTGFKPWYLEQCSSTLASTFSSGTPGHDESIVTVDQDARLRPDKICTSEHTGTSASAPIAAAVCALALEANPGLTWRDMQYLVVMTSTPGPLIAESGWLTNGRGRQYNHKFGYGLIDTGAMVDLAEKWRNVPLQHICQSSVMITDVQIPDGIGDRARVSMTSDGCAGTINAVNHLEHVQCKVSLTYIPRGNIMMVLTSPSGSRSTLLFPRPRDTLGSRFDEWPFLSVHFFGESAVGTWNLEVMNMGPDRTPRPGKGLLHKWQMIWYGTEHNPVRLPRQSESFPTSSSFSPASSSSFAPSSFPSLSNVFSSSTFQPKFPQSFFSLPSGRSKRDFNSTISQHMTPPQK